MFQYKTISLLKNRVANKLWTIKCSSNCGFMSTRPGPCFIHSGVFSPWIPTPSSILIGTQPITTTDNFTYIGSTIASKTRTFYRRQPPHSHRHIYLVQFIIKMDFVSPVPCHTNAPLQLPIISISTYSSASSTLANAKQLRHDAFNTNAFRCLFGGRWYDHVTNAPILTSTGQTSLTIIIRKLGVCCLPPGTKSISPSSWRRPR